MFDSVHLERGDGDEVNLHEFLEGCGIRVKTCALTDDQGWVEEAYKQRHNDEEESVVRPMCHTISGDKTRPLGYRVTADPLDVWYYLVQDYCPFADRRALGAEIAPQRFDRTMWCTLISDVTWNSC